MAVAPDLMTRLLHLLAAYGAWCLLRAVGRWLRHCVTDAIWRPEVS